MYSLARMLDVIKKLKTGRIIRFVISGGSAAIIEYGTFLLLSLALHTNVLVANSISFLCGLITSFLLNKHWVFGSKNAAHKEFVHYFILAIVNLCISTGLVWFMVNIHIPSFVAKLIAMVIIAIWNYFIFSRLIFKSTDEDAII